jgi:hypothetical protein
MALSESLGDKPKITFPRRRNASTGAYRLDGIKRRNVATRALPGRDAGAIAVIADCYCRHSSLSVCQ